MNKTQIGIKCGAHEEGETRRTREHNASRVFRVYEWAIGVRNRIFQVMSVNAVIKESENRARGPPTNGGYTKGTLGNKISLFSPPRGQVITC